MYTTKDVAVYQDIIKLSNKNITFKEVWHGYFAPKKYISDDNYLCEKYKVSEKFEEMDNFRQVLDYFVKRYTEDVDQTYDYDNVRRGGLPFSEIKKYQMCGRSDEQLTLMAQRMGEECAARGIVLESNAEKDVERMKDLIIGHACYETLIGFYVEYEVRRYLLRKGKNLTVPVEETEAATVMDSMGADILISDEENKIKAILQIKPITFINGRESGDLISDRAKCYTQNDPYFREYALQHPEKFSKGKVPEWYYLFYNKRTVDNGDFRFNDKCFARFGHEIRGNSNPFFMQKEHLWDRDGHMLYDAETLRRNIEYFILF